MSIMKTADRPHAMNRRQDAIFLEVFWARVRSIADEAAKLIVRTSFSTLSTEANDFTVVVTDSAGRCLTENSGSIPAFIGTLPATVQAVIAKYPHHTLRPGDVFITNDPWIGTGHLNDVCLVKPVFHLGKVVAFAATAGHVPDIGGRFRSVNAHELFEEGLQIPVIRLLDQGAPNEAILDMIRTNVRTPDQTAGDIWSQASAVELVARRLGEVLVEYALPGVDDIAEALFERGDRALRKAISALPDGQYRYAMQTDGFKQRLDLAVTVRIEGDAITCDFTGTSPQQPRAINCPLGYTTAMAVYAIKCLLVPDIPNSDGMLRAIRVEAPEHSLLNPARPAAVGGRASTGHYLPVLIFGAMHAVLPERVMAGAGSPLWSANISGTGADGLPMATVLFFNGGMGATCGKDGAAVMSWPSNISPTPVEVAERDIPLFFRYKRLRVDSGGPGQWRGGLGEEVCMVSRHDRPLSVVFLAERTREPAPGLGGGQAGVPGAVWINGVAVDVRERHLLNPGDELVMRTPGGGGFGPPGQRDPALADHDYRLGYSAAPGTARQS
ncbi:hydantoinase B/oxoprolinase family protein [Bordetella bronchiseptica]|uniref:hydantoinase B/oxoprolinase family protein n=1 Tax=Bordetella bronchiseptica TaxID=518 RepID=UPI00052860FE|nr:hydantoinase B/oxoprolinase family protein [Bordetella bronchiseptica]